MDLTNIGRCRTTTDKFLTREQRMSRQHTLIKTSFFAIAANSFQTTSCSNGHITVVSAHKSVCGMECRCSLICSGIYLYRMNRASGITIIKADIDYNKESLPSPHLP